MYSVKYADFDSINKYHSWRELNFYDHHGVGNINLWVAFGIFGICTDSGLPFRSFLFQHECENMYTIQ